MENDLTLYSALYLAHSHQMNNTLYLALQQWNTKFNYNISY